MNTRTVSVRWITVEICDVVHIGHNQLPKKNKDIFYGSQRFDWRGSVLFYLRNSIDLSPCSSFPFYLLPLFSP